MPKKNLPHKAWSCDYQYILKELQVSAEKGLDSRELRRRQKEYGKNRLREVKKKSSWIIFIDQIASPIMALLVAATVLSFAFNQTLEGFAIIGVIILTTAIGFFTEIKAVRSMEALRKLSQVHTTVLRDGETKQINALNVVPGDIIILEGGDIVTADLRIIESNKLQADESALTGESVPVSKSTITLDDNTDLAERNNMLFKGTSVTRGSGKAVAINTGMKTELGKISSLVDQAEQETTPLEKRLDRLGHKLIWFTVGIASFVAVTGIFQGKEILLMIETGIALAVAAIPEGLPIVATVALARGLIRMAKRNALINRFGSVEKLGSTNIICTDKTGTLTENKMTVTKIAYASGESDSDIFTDKSDKIDPDKDKLLYEALKIGALCNNASFKQNDDNGKNVVGDPLEVALLEAAAKADIHRGQLLESLPEKYEDAFDSDTKMMATFHKQNGDFYVAVKGAPETVLQSCSKILTNNGSEDFGQHKIEKYSQLNDQMAAQGLRVLALAQKNVNSTDTDPYKELNFVGLTGMHDPPREEIKDAINSCKQAGIRIIMVTGDQAATARYVAKQLQLTNNNELNVSHGKEVRSIEKLSTDQKNQILDTAIFARVSPEQKLNLISLHQDNNSVVGMTGDGVNDAPALKKADIGIAMGKRGTQVAQEAADMILQDDSFPTIVTAIEYGRVIFGNIRKFVLFLLSGNVGEILSVGLAASFSLPLPLLPLQILFINLILDVFPALALGVGGATHLVMKKPPRDPKEPVLTKQHWLLISFYGIVIAIAVLAALSIALFYFNMPQKQAVTVSFLTLGFARLWHVFNMREKNVSLFKNEITKNPFVWAALVLCAVLLIATIVFTPLSRILDVQNPGLNGWILIFGMSLVPLIIGQLYRAIVKTIRKYRKE